MKTLPMSARGALQVETGRRGPGSGPRGLAPAPLAPPTGPASPVVWAAAPTTAESADPDARLMVLVGEGDRAAFRTLFRRYQAPLVNFLRRMVLDREEAEDLAQDVFLSVYQAAPRYRPEAKFSTWLYRIATNAALNARKSRHRHPTIALDALGSMVDRIPSARAEATDRALEREEIAAAVERALRRLPERQRAAVVLQRFEGLSYDEIAAALGVSTDAVDALLRRAKVALRDALAPYRGA